MKGYTYRHLQQESVRGGRRKCLLWVGLGLIALALLAALAFPQSAGGQQAAKMTLSEYHLAPVEAQIVSLPVERTRVFLTAAGDGIVLGIFHPKSSESREALVLLKRATDAIEPEFANPPEPLANVGVGGVVRYLFIQEFSACPTATPTAALPPPPTCERGAECPYPTLPHPAGLGR